MLAYETVLIVDDDDSVVQTYRMALDAEGYNVITATTGLDGLAQARAHMPDLLLVDITMPLLDGKRVLSTLREDPDLGDKQIVLMTGDPQLANARTAMELGADDFLKKPCSIGELLRCVDARLSRARIHRRIEDDAIQDLRNALRASLPHEFFTPMAGILGTVDILKRENATLGDAERVEILHDLDQSARRLHRTLKNYLSALDEPEQEHSAALLTGPALSAALQAGLERALSRHDRRADLTVQVEDCTLLVEPRDLEAIVEELVDNACCYSRRGSPIHVGISRDGALRVADSGRGMTTAQVSQLGAFKQFDRSRFEQQGLWLGISLVNKLAQKYGAQVSVASRSGYGTTVSVAFNAATGKGAETIAALLAERDRLKQELVLRDSALNAAASEFAIIDMRASGQPIVYANQALAKNHGYEVHELIGRSSRLLADLPNNPEARKRLRLAIKQQTDARLELNATRRDGTRFVEGLHLQPLFDPDGHLTHYVSVGANITPRLEAEQKGRELQEQLLNEMREREKIAVQLRFAQKLEAVGRLAAGVAHEINTPVQYIGDSVYFVQSAFNDVMSLIERYRGALQSHLSTDAPILTDIAGAEQAADLEFMREEVPKSFARISDGVARIAQIVRAMKELSHPDNTEHHSADLNRAIETTLIVSRNEYKYVAQVQTELGELPQVMCNSGELSQVFLNLIVNAAHAIKDRHGEDGLGLITIRTRALADQVELEFEDNGCGIPQEHLDKIFDPFFTTKEVGQGTGQGLAITRAIVVDKHRGAVDVHSEVGVGTRFRLSLPLGTGTGVA